MKKQMECAPGECEYYDEEDERCMAFECNGFECPALPCEVADSD